MALARLVAHLSQAAAAAGTSGGADGGEASGIG